MRKIQLSASGKGRPSKQIEPMYALVDDADYDWLNQWNWTAVLTNRKCGGYASRTENGAAILMHRLILNASDGEEVDHEDGHGLNNQRRNLRKATRKQAIENRGAFRTNKSGFKGVRFNKSSNKWQMSITSLHDTPEEAALTYDRVSKILHGEFSRLNFPDKTDRA